MEHDDIITWYCELRAYERSHVYWDYGDIEDFSCSSQLGLGESEIREAIDRLSQTRGCLFCKTELTPLLNQKSSDRSVVRYYSERETYGCRACGWWRGEYVDGIERTDGRKSEGNYAARYAEGILKRFALGDSDLPIRALRQYLEKHPYGIVHVSPGKFEELAKVAYEEYFDCEVIQVGGPGDNGVDLYAIIGDEPQLIQVKRRSKSGAIEGVSAVRELVGTVVLHGARKGHLVTSAERFSRAAVATAQAHTLTNASIEVTLVARDELFGMLRLRRRNIRDCWNGSL